MTIPGVLEYIGNQLARIADALETIVCNEYGPPKPAKCALRVTNELPGGDDVADKLNFVFVVPAEDEPSDVVSREVKLTLADGTVSEFVNEGNGAFESAEFTADQDSEVSISVVNVDDAGNKSVPRVQSFTLVDTIAPPAPGELGVKVVGEVVE